MISADQVERILVSVLDWTGTRMELEPEKGSTPARVAHLEGLVAAGRLSAEEAAGFVGEGGVSDADWDRVKGR